VVVGTTINGAPIPVSGDGEVRTALLLPAHRPSRVTIGIVAGGSLRTDGSAPVDYDPAHPETLLVFDVAPAFASVRGRVAGFGPDELGTLGIGFALRGEQQARLTRPAADGAFELARLPRGEGELFLVRDGAVAEVLGRLHVVVDRDLEGLVLGPDPESLPELPPDR